MADPAAAALQNPGGYPGAWGVFLLFTIPIGGGIPAGVLLAKARGIAWPAMMVLYFVSDVVLACVFEPVMNLVVAAGKSIPALARACAAIKASTLKTAAHFGTTGGPLTLVMIAFGVDPMTGRAAAKAAGHGFVSGWTIAITGDMMYFTVIMVSTLWLNSILGDGTWTMVIIMAGMFFLPSLIRKVRGTPAPA